MSRLDKSLTNASYEIEVDHAAGVPISITMTLLAAVKGETEMDAKKKIVGGKHVAFTFKYTLSDFGKVEKLEVPAEAQKVLAKI